MLRQNVIAVPPITKRQRICITSSWSVFFFFFFWLGEIWVVFPSFSILLKKKVRQQCALLVRKVCVTLVLYYTNTDSRLMSIQAAGIFVLCWSITYTSSFLPFIILVLYSFSSFLPLAIFCISAIPLTLPCAVSISGLHIPFSLAAFLNIYQFLFIYLFFY